MAKRRAASLMELDRAECQTGGVGRLCRVHLVPSPSAFKIRTLTVVTEASTAKDAPINETPKFKNLVPEVSEEMKKLNEAFLVELTSCLSLHPDSILHPMFESYVQHVQKILKPHLGAYPNFCKYIKAAEENASTETSHSQPIPGCLLGVPQSSAFPDDNQNTSSKAIPYGFMEMEKNPTPSSSRTINISNPLTNVVVPQTSAFPLLPQPSTHPSQDYQEVEMKDEETDVPPMVEFKQVTEDNALYNVRCKVFEKVDNAFLDKGVGQLFVKQLENGFFQLVVRAEDALGTILMNILLQKGLPLNLKGKEIWTCDPNRRKLMAIRVKNGDAATELFGKIQEFLPK